MVLPAPDAPRMPMRSPLRMVNVRPRKRSRLSSVKRNERLRTEISRSKGSVSRVGTPGCAESGSWRAASRRMGMV